MALPALRTTQAGFSLIELMIVVVIVGILAAVALPAYNDYLRRGARADAESQMMDIASRQGQYLLDNRSYAATLTDLGVSLPASVTKKYSVTLDVAAGPPPTFSITATPLGDQTKDTCGKLNLNSAGTKSASGTGSCW